MSRTKAFFKAFFITLAIMSAAAILMLSEIPDLSAPKKNTSGGDLQDRVYTPTAEDKFTLLLTLTKAHDTPPYAYFLLNFDGMQQRLNILRLPAQTVLSQNGESKVILSEQYKKGASPLAARAVSKYFGGEVSRYITVDNSNLHSLFSLFDPTEIEISQNLYEIDRKNEIYIKIDRGRQLLSAFGMVDLIAATSWEGGQKQALYESARTLAVFLNQNGDEIFKSSSCKLEKFVLNHTTNNFSVMDFEKRRELVCYILSSKTAAQSVTIDGENKSADTEFHLTKESFEKIQKMLKKGVENP